jgi:hypothetical protein
MSDKDTQVGSLWGEKLSGELEGSNFGIICLTPDNLESRWIHFEAGALSKVVGQARVVPLLCSLINADVGLPLSRFQMTSLDKNGMCEVVKSMNSTLDAEVRMGESELKKLFEGMWPALKQQLDELPPRTEAPRRSDRKLLEDILELVRSNIGFSNVTPSASGPKPLYIDHTGRILPADMATSFFNSTSGELLRGTGPEIPPKVMERMRRIAGPDGLVTTDPSAIIIQSPRVGADDFTTDEQMFLDTTREFLEMRGIKLTYLDRPGIRRGN